MQRKTRRSLLGLFCVVPFLTIPGCRERLSNRDSDSSNTTNQGTDKKSSDTKTPIQSKIEELEEECIQSEFVGYTSTTPVPKPNKPENLDTESALIYITAYEKYYNQYLALYDKGPSTPEGSEGPAHEFPDVRVSEIHKEIQRKVHEGYIAIFSYNRYFEGENMGEYTIKYYISESYLIRVEVEGVAQPGPNPIENGKIMTC